MGEFILNVLIWTLALYGLIEIIKNIVYSRIYRNTRSNGIYLIVAVKNKEDEIEGFLRSILFRFLHCKDENVQNVIVTDLESQDNTLGIIYSLQRDYECLEVLKWEECKEMLDELNKNLET